MLSGKWEAAMPYQITYEPWLPIAGVTAKTVERETAAEAWASVTFLVASDEKTTIIDAYGWEISREELRARAQREFN
jgi:hypothetical protein